MGLLMHAMGITVAFLCGLLGLGIFVLFWWTGIGAIFGLFIMALSLMSIIRGCVKATKTT